MNFNEAKFLAKIKTVDVKSNKFINCIGAKLSTEPRSKRPVFLNPGGKYFDILYSGVNIFSTGKVLLGSRMKIKGNRSLSSRLWLDRQINDPYVKLAQKEGYRSRAAFKLMEMDDKFRLIKNAKHIVDLGAAPGGWSQVLAQRSADDAKIAAVDLLPFNPMEKVQQFLGDFENFQTDIMDYLGQKADLIISDIAPSTIGHAQTDHLRIMNLVDSAYLFAENALQKGGAFIAKIFQGGKEKLFAEALKNDFQKVCFFKPKSSRNLSSEIYIVAIGFQKCS
ncbi:MAG: RlmE family RNA methyltransferase [Holosporaceae bacterium]|jgi:23S rRNA (uridine2552-2'-O)-methyltransferase|nr:RlmE family RNA methyltransferase [Holosporaceae bacterium]